MPTLQELGQAVAKRRKSLGLRQGPIAALAGISPETLSRFERGHVAEFGTRKLLVVMEAVGIELQLLTPPDDDAPLP
ncbi:MAG: helix-turn-helix domain-containing protein [Pseudomonadota bacterium]